MSSARDDFAVVALLLIFLVAVFAYGYYSTHPPNTQQRALIEYVQLRSTSVDITGLNRTGLSLNLNAVVYNPNGFGATLNSVNYSVYASGRYLGSGKTAHKYDLAPQSSQTLVFPISMSWNSALQTTGSYIVDGGHVAWEIRGTANISAGGLPLSAPFEFTTG